MEIKFPCKIIVKTNSKKNEVVFYENNEVYKVNIKAKPVKGQANKEIIKFFSRLTGKKIRIMKGLKGKEKILDVV